MNFLAHIYLSGVEDEDLMIGNFMGDLIKGRKLHTFKESIQQGIKLHHRIDNFTDSHPEWQRVRSLIRPDQGKYSGVVTDIFFDHMLAIHWSRFHPQTLDIFADRVYSILQRRSNELPPRGQQLLPFMIQHNWLLSYQTVEGISAVLEGMSKRTPYASNMANAAALLATFEKEIDAAFLNFFPELIHSVGN